MPQAILINGPSSSGKTTLAKGLQESLDSPYLLTGIDLLIREMLPKKFFLSTSFKTSPDFYWKKEVDPTGFEVMRLYMGERALLGWRGLIAATVGLLRAGNSVIIDEVFFMGSWQMEAWKEALRSWDLFTIGLDCSLEVLERREIERKDRMPNSSRGQFFVVHEKNSYDLRIDTSTHGRAEVLQIALNAIRDRSLVPHRTV